MTIESLRVIYDREHSQAGNTDYDFWVWAVEYLLKEDNKHKKTLEQINRHIGDIKKEIKKF